MKIVLIKPPEYGLQDQLAYPPMGLLYVAASLEGAGHEVNLCVLTDDNYSVIPVADLYGINMHSPGTFGAVRVLAKYLKDEHPDIPIVAGGAFATSMPDYVLDNSDIDIIVRGEGEKIILNLVERIVECEISKTLGISYRKNGQNIHTKNEFIIEDLDELPFPARHLLPESYVKHTGLVHHSGGNAATTLFLSRGCPYSCNFCDKGVWGRKYRVRSVDNVIEEIKLVQHQYGINHFRIVDDNLMVNMIWFNGLLDELIPLNIQWSCLARADDINVSVLTKMKDAGCTEIFFGTESGSEKMLKLMNKKMSVWANARAFDMCREVGIKSCAYIMFGFPGEDKETVEDTIRFLSIAKPDKSSVKTFLPVPGSDVYNFPGRYGIKINFDPDKFWCFDNHEFAVEYPMGNEKMQELKLMLMKFYREAGYIDGWTK